MHILVRIHNTVVLNNQKKIKLSKLTLGIHGDKADSRPCSAYMSQRVRRLAEIWFRHGNPEHAAVSGQWRV